MNDHAWKRLNTEIGQALRDFENLSNPSQAISLRSRSLATRRTSLFETIKKQLTELSHPLPPPRQGGL